VKGLDTNVLVRYLTEDEDDQARRAARYIASTTARGQRCFIGPVVLCELVWVLRDAYDYSKAEVVTTLDQILATVQFEIGSKDLVRQALDAYRSGPGDFADHLIGAIGQQAGCDETATFDRRLRSIAGFRLL
jgi:predicted nucleic-acid-binding protein